MNLLRRRVPILFAVMAAAIAVTIPVLASSGSNASGLSGVQSLVGDNAGTYCAVLSSGSVDCWGYGGDGELGNGDFYSSSQNGSDTPVQVVGVGGSGTLSGVAALIGGDNNPAVGKSSGFCALLTSGGVDCWGYGSYGDLGNGSTSSSAIPVQVVGVGGTGTLSGVAALASSPGSFCARLTSGAVDCWGYGPDGELGNGVSSNSTVPVQVKGVGGSGTLSSVASLTGSGIVEGYPSFAEQPGYCALLTSGGVDCWGSGGNGQLGSGSSTSSATPIQVKGVGGSGTLSGVGAVTSDGFGYCALLTSAAVDCWGYGSDGELGNNSSTNSATPVQVKGVGGSGTLSAVGSLTSGVLGYCALLTSGGVDCWGYGGYGELGNGGSSSSTPAQVQGVGGVGTLSGISSLSSEGLSFCASGSGKVVCWGYGSDSELGNGVSTSSSTPVAVAGVGGSGNLSQVASVTGNYLGSYCALLSFGGVDCWGDGSVGELGNGAFTASATPVQVSSVVAISCSTAVPSNGATVSGSSVTLDAVPTSGASQVQFELSGGSLNNSIIATGALTYYGWIANWNSQSVPNGTYTLQSVASFGGTTVTSAGISITVNNPAPTITTTAPSNGATVSGSSVTLGATPSTGTTQVQFELSGGSLNNSIIATGASTQQGWVASWNSQSVPNGTYTLQSVATAGQVSGTSAPITITVNNPAPGVTVVLPSNPATLSGTSQALDATASTGVIQVQFELSAKGLDGSVIATATPTNYGWIAVWNTTSVPNGTYTLQSFASYAGGVTGTSTGVTVTIAN